MSFHFDIKTPTRWQKEIVTILHMLRYCNGKIGVSSCAAFTLTLDYEVIWFPVTFRQYEGLNYLSGE